MSRGQRLAVRVLAFALRRRGLSAALQLQHTLDRAFPHRSLAERAAMWNAAMDRAYPDLARHRDNG